MAFIMIIIFVTLYALSESGKERGAKNMQKNRLQKTRGTQIGKEGSGEGNLVISCSST